MITLHTLGPARVLGGDERRVRRLLAQPKRWALLAYLAVEGTDAAVPRDRVLGVFWPEVDQRHARGSLRNALHFLRGVVGAEAIVSVGDQLSVSSERLSCDAVSLLRATSDGAALLEMYRGDFLEGIHVDEPEFEYWVDGVRSSVRARASALAWTEADGAAEAGAWITAARFGRRAVELAVDIEAASQRLIGILDGAGDRAAALAEYARLASDLEERYGVAPSPETEALVSGIRARTDARRPAGTARPEHADPSRDEPTPTLAVLPFRILGGDDAEHIARGVSEDLVVALAALEGLRVVSRTSVDALLDEDGVGVSDLRDRLGAELTVEGSVRTGGDRVRVTVQLVETAGHAQRWAATYDRARANVFDVQSDVALSIARALQVELSPRTHRRLRSPTTRNAEAHERYLRARRLWQQRSAPSLDEAIAQLERAVQTDPDFALGWVGLADAHLVRTSLAGGDSAAQVARARAALARALELDPESGEGRATLGTLRLFFDGDVQGALREYRRAVRLSPGYATARHWLGNLLVVDGQVDEGLAELSVARELDPLSALVHENVGLALYHADRLEAARVSYARAMELDAGYWRAYWSDGLALARLGDPDGAADRIVTGWTLGGHRTGPDTARAARAALRAAAPAAAVELRTRAAQGASDTERTSRVAEALLFTLLDRPEDALSALEQASDEGTLPLLLVHAPSLDPLAGRRRFSALLDALGYTPARWRGRAG